MKNLNLPAWRFIARKYEPAGQKITGIIHAYTLLEVAEELVLQGLFPTIITLELEKVNWRLTQKIAVTRATFKRIIKEQRLEQLVENGQISLFFPKKRIK